MSLQSTFCSFCLTVVLLSFIFLASIFFSSTSRAALRLLICFFIDLICFIGGLIDLETLKGTYAVYFFDFLIDTGDLFLENAYIVVLAGIYVMPLLSSEVGRFSTIWCRLPDSCIIFCFYETWLCMFLKRLLPVLISHFYKMSFG